MTLSALGIFSAAGAGGGPLLPSDFDLIESFVVSGSPTSIITFSSLGTYSSTYKHLQIRAVGRTTSSGLNAVLRFNGDTGNNYNGHQLVGRGALGTVTSGLLTYTDKIETFFMNTSTATANAFSSGVIDILDPYSTTKNKTIRTMGGIIDNEYSFAIFRSGLWRNSASVTSISLFTESGNFADGSRFSLYGIK
jgi:hypothetical protein